mmetsp:Transcript_24352/g.51012  ORF Transcript_24352/g.51012 Transcript_24352/m.51012 type:complete len:282 (-) Transcript_24352:199-1044(-)
MFDPCSRMKLSSKVTRLRLHRNGISCAPNLPIVTSSFASSSLAAAAPNQTRAPAKSITLNTYTCFAYHQPQPFQNKYYHQQQGLALFSTRTRRRRRQGGGSSIPSNPNPVEDTADDHSTSSSANESAAASLSSEHFLSASMSLLDRVQSAVTKLKDCNDGLEIKRHPPSSSSDSSPNHATPKPDNTESIDPTNQPHGGQLSYHVLSSGDLYWGGGTYLLTIHPDNDADRGGTVALRSPLSGSFTYVYNPSSKEWVGEDDGHSLLGMLTRDWIRQCRGVPDF